MKNGNRKDRIIKTAAALFKQKGFESSSMREIAKAEGIEAASLYSHINSKEELLESICFDMADKFIKSIDEVNDLYFNAEEKLFMAIKNHVKIITDNLDYSTVFIREWRKLPKQKINYFINLRKKYEDGFKQILINGENENVFSVPDKKFAVLTILSAVNWITEWYNPKGEMNSDEIAEHLYNFILKGLKSNT
jgi:AcrR family transcriptional regulator